MHIHIGKNGCPLDVFGKGSVITSSTVTIEQQDTENHDVTIKLVIVQRPLHDKMFIITAA